MATQHSLPGTDTWALDVTDTTASFEVAEFSLRTVTGTVPVTAAALEFDESGGLLSASVELDPARVTTGHLKRDRDLRGPKFFAVEQHPVWTFRAAAAVPTDGGWTVPGQLTIREELGIELAVRPAPATGDPDIRILTAETELDRRAAGVRGAPGLVVGHRIRISLRIVLRRLG